MCRIDTVISASVEIEGELSESEGYIRAMEIEFRTMSSVEKRGAQQKVCLQALAMPASSHVALVDIGAQRGV
jgi:hypothetical protein